MVEASVARAQNELNRRYIDAIRAGGGTLPERASGAAILLLTTTARRTGQSRTVPLLYTSGDQSRSETGVRERKTDENIHEH
jgi:F420H(2)-dependent quinone reductase